MPDLLASTSLLPLTPAIPGRATPIAVPAVLAVPAVADFMAMLGELVLPPGAKPQGGKGQALAGSGKDLPAEGAVAAADEDEADPLVAWLPVGLVPIAPPEPVSLPDTTSVAVAPSPGIETIAFVEAPADTHLPGLPPVAVEVSAPPIDGPASVPIAKALPIATAASDSALSEAPVGARAPVDTFVVDAVAVDVIAVAGEADAAPPQTAVAPQGAPRGKADAPVREVSLRPAPVHAAVLQPVVPGVSATQTAAQVFAAAISASFDSPAAPALRATDPVAVQAHSVATDQLRTTVQAMSGADQLPLDLSRDDWAGKMIDRIATLRDAAEATDTRIRLAPENLGNVDVSIRRDGDRLHVHFAAENPATRQMLADAAPRLAELADARGVKLGQTSVDAGTGGQQEHSNQPQSNQSARPASAIAGQSQSDRDDRVA
jgi:flagellar hook-length control protein FliK